MSDNLTRTEKREMRFGVVAVEKGFVTPDQLFEALKVQVQEDLESETHRLVGEILVEQGAITPEQRDEVLEVLEAVSHVFGP
jgi:hypothetical protein